MAGRVIRALEAVGIFLSAVIFVVLVSDLAGYNLSSYILGSVFPVTITPEKLQATYKTAKIKVLVVPGHDNETVGAVFRGLNETDLTLEVAKHLVGYFKKDPRFEVFTTRDFASGEYTKEFATFFTANAEDIRSFRAQLRKNMRQLVALGAVERKVKVARDDAQDDISFRLFGINKWANDNDIDIVLHLHFNDYPAHIRNVPGKYTGFTIYTPDKQFGNAVASKELSRVLFDQLATFFAPSDFPLEEGGIIEDQELIALGSNASLKGAAGLIEYGYIYEPQFQAPAISDVVMAELAYQTYRGLKNYFGSSIVRPLVFDTTFLPYHWTEVLESGLKASRSVLALQAALRREGAYPPTGKTIQDCPVNGSFGLCTKAAVTLFQRRFLKESVNEGELGVVGHKTILELNRLYGI